MFVFAAAQALNSPLQDDNDTWKMTSLTGELLVCTLIDSKMRRGVVENRLNLTHLADSKHPDLRRARLLSG